MKHLRYLLMAALVAMPLTACDEDDDPIVDDPIYGTVTGTVSAEGTGLAGVAVTLVGATQQSASTGSGGTYTFTNVEAGSYGISIDASSHPDVSFPVTSKTTNIVAQAETKTVDFTEGSYIRTAAIVGTVTADGAPLSGVAVTVSGGPDNITDNNVTDAAGSFAATGLRAGDYTVEIDDTGLEGVEFASTSASVTVTTGGTKTANFPGNVTQMAMINGVVLVDNEGQAGVAVDLIMGGAVIAETESGAGGAFTFGNLVPGSYTVTITAPEDVTFNDLSKTKDLVEGEVWNVNFAGVTPAEPATLSIKSITKNGAPVNLAMVAGQIEVTLNVTRGDRDLDRVEVLIDDEIVATQKFAVAAAPAELAPGDQEEVTLNVPTTQLRMGTDTYVPVVFNGGANVSANLYEVGAEAPIPTNEVPVVMANADALLTSDGALIPGVVTRYEPGFEDDINTGTGLNWNTGGIMYDGPIYISYSTTEQVPAWTDQAGICGVGTGSVMGTYDTGMVLSNVWTCAGEEGQNVGPGLSLPAFTGPGVGPDGTAVTTPVAWASLGAKFALTGEDRWYVLSPTPLTATAPAVFDVDNLGPTVSMQPVAYNQNWDEWWINNEYSLIDGLIPPDADNNNRGDDPIQLDDDGVGPDWDSREARLPGTFVEPDGDPDYYTCDVAVTNADLDPTNTSDWDVDGHMICGFGTDLLGNPPQNYSLPMLPENPNSETFGFGKDTQAPDVYIIGDSPGAAAPANCTPPYPGLTEGMDMEDNLFNIDNAFPAGIGFGVDAIDDRAGFHQNDAAEDGPVYQSITRYYPDIASDDTDSSTQYGPEWLANVLDNNYVRSSQFATDADDCVDVAGGYFNPVNPGLYEYYATVTDMAGNSVSMMQNFATDQVNIPVFNNMVLGQLSYTAGEDGLFLMYGSDDFEVGHVQVSMTYPTDPGQDGTQTDFEVIYPAELVDMTQSPWDMDYPFDRVAPFNYEAGLLDLGIIGRIDFTDDTGGTVADFNTINSDGDAGPDDDDFLPTAVTGWIATDILGNGPSATTVTQDFIGFDFGGWTNSTAAPWPAPATDITTWELLDEGGTQDPNDFVAQHTAPNSVVNPFFDAVVLVHNDADGTLTVCGEMSVVTQQDQGFNRFYRYELPAQFNDDDELIDPDIADVCLSAEAGDSFHAAGVKGSASGAALLVTDAAVSVVIPGL